MLKARTTHRAALVGAVLWSTFGLAPTAIASTATTTTLSGWVLSGGVGVAGATAIEYAWPNAKTLAALPRGATVPVLRLGTARTGLNGSYSMPVHLKSLPATYRQAGGAVDTQTDVFSGVYQSTYNTVLPPATVTRTSPGVLNSESFDLPRKTAVDTNSVMLDSAHRSPSPQPLSVNAHNVVPGTTRAASPDREHCYTTPRMCGRCTRRFTASRMVTHTCGVGSTR